MAGLAMDKGENSGVMVSLCSLLTGGRVFGIDTRLICEVLGEHAVQRVPQAPPFIAGVIPNRGEVLTTVNFRAVLGMEAQSGTSSVLVLEDEESRERFGLMVDAVSSVVIVSAAMLEPNPSTLEPRCKTLFDGAYKMATGLIVSLDPQKLRPVRLAEMGLFSSKGRGESV